MSKKIDHFKILSTALKVAGYKVKVQNLVSYYDDDKENKIKYRFARVTGRGIIGGFSDTDIGVYQYIANRFAADNKKCFDKYSKCPLCVKLTYNIELLLLHLEILGSKTGYRISNSYDYVDANPFPYELIDEE